MIVTKEIFETHRKGLLTPTEHRALQNKYPKTHACFAKLAPHDGMEVRYHWDLRNKKSILTLTVNFRMNPKPTITLNSIKLMAELKHGAVINGYEEEPDAEGFFWIFINKPNVSANSMAADTIGIRSDYSMDAAEIFLQESGLLVEKP